MKDFRDLGFSFSGKPGLHNIRLLQILQAVCHCRCQVLGVPCFGISVFTVVNSSQSPVSPFSSNLLGVVVD